MKQQMHWLGKLVLIALSGAAFASVNNTLPNARPDNRALAKKH